MKLYKWEDDWLRRSTQFLDREIRSAVTFTPSIHSFSSQFKLLFFSLSLFLSHSVYFSLFVWLVVFYLFCLVDPLTLLLYRCTVHVAFHFLYFSPLCQPHPVFLSFSLPLKIPPIKVVSFCIVLFLSLSHFFFKPCPRISPFLFSPFSLLIQARLVRLNSPQVWAQSHWKWGIGVPYVSYCQFIHIKIVLIMTCGSFVPLITPYLTKIRLIRF